MRRTLIASVVMMLWFAPPASAEVGVVLVTGTLKQRQSELAESAASDALRGESWNFVDPPLNADERAAVATCMGLERPWNCVAGSLTGKTVDRVALVDVRPDKTTPGEPLAVTVQIAAPGMGVATTESTHCDKPCTDDRLRGTTMQIVAATAKTAATNNPSVELEIRSTPPGATITFDGGFIGTTNRTVKTTNGPHSVLVQLDGYQPATRTVNIRSDAGSRAEPIDVTLVPTSGGLPPGSERPGPGPSPGSAHKHSLLLPGIAIGVGVAAFVGGWAYSRSADPSATFEQQQHLDNKAGIGISIAGGVVAVASVVWLWAWSRGDKPSSTPTVSISASEATLGWTTTF